MSDRAPSGCLLRSWTLRNIHEQKGESITSTGKVANKFCKYFTNIGLNLADKIAPASKSFQDFISSVPSDSLSSFNHVTAEELKSIAKGFKDGKASEADNIPISIIKKTLDLISDPLLSIIAELRQPDAGQSPILIYIITQVILAF